MPSTTSRASNAAYGAGIELADINLATKVGNNLILRIGTNKDQLATTN